MAKLAAATWAAIGVGVAAVGVYQQQKAGKEQSAQLGRSADLQAKSLEAQRKANDLKAARERRQVYRQSRAVRAEMTNIAGASQVDVSGGSSFLSGRGGVGTAAGADVAFVNQQQDLAQQQSIFNIGATRASAEASQAAIKGSMWGDVASLGGTIFGNRQGLSEIKFT